MTPSRLAWNRLTFGPSTANRSLETTDSKHNFPIHPNLLLDFRATAINQVWVADITYIRILTGFAYLATILDAFSRKELSK